MTEAPGASASPLDAVDAPALGPTPDVAAQLFGERLPAMESYAALLATWGVERGLIGPRETPRLWDRHLLNCAGLVELLPERSRVADLGSGAGLPGIVLAIARPDLSLVLVEPLLRRSTFLTEVVDVLGLPNVEVRRARAEELAGELTLDVVVARAVAALPLLAGWALPLLRPGGRLLALKGERAVAELAEARPAMKGSLAVLDEATPHCTEVGGQDQATWARVVIVERSDRPLPGRGPGAPNGAGRPRTGPGGGRATSRRSPRAKSRPTATPRSAAASSSTPAIPPIPSSTSPSPTKQVPTSPSSTRTT